MDEVARNGCTVLFVSHNLAAVQRLCRRAILLDRGRIASDGPTAEVVDRYLAETAARAEPDCWTALASPHTPEPKVAVFTAARYIDPQRPNCHPRSMGPARFEVRIAATTSMPAMLAADIADELGNKLINLDLWKINGSHADLPRGESVWRFDLEHVYLKPGRYFVTLWLATTTGSTIDYRPMALRIELASDDPMRAEGDTPNQEDGLVPCRASIVRVGEREPA
jgi:lipopolysaccharide transport system ATP-binding protein